MTLTQIAIAASGDDGTVSKTSNTYPPGGAITVDTTGTLHAVQRALSGANYTIRPMITAFNTSPVPDTDIISAATLELGISSLNFNNVNARNLVGEWYAAYTGSIVAGDWTDTPSSTAFSIALSALVLDAVNIITLTAPDANIDKAGVTALRIVVDGGQPTGLNRVNIASFDNTTLQEPRLNITHDAPAAGGQPMSLRRRFFMTGAQRIARGS